MSDFVKETTTFAKPKVSSSSQKELDKIEEQSKQFNDQVNALTMDRMNEAPRQEVEPQTKLSSKEISNSKDIYLKPHKTISSKEKFNEKYREDYNFMKEYVQFIAEHKEIQGEDIDLWTKPFAGMPAEEWIVPTNKPVWAPRYVAEQIRKRQYHRLSMNNTNPTGNSYAGQMYGQLVVDSIVQRMDAYPVSSRKSIFT